MKTEQKNKIATDLREYLDQPKTTKSQLYKDSGLSEFTINRMLRDEIDSEVGDNSWRMLEHFLESGEKFEGYPHHMKLKIQKQIREHLASRKDISQNKLAAMIGVSTAVISNSINSKKYSQDKLISNEMWRKLRSPISLHEATLSLW